jgi:hypothetical protein
MSQAPAQASVDYGYGHLIWLSIAIVFLIMVNGAILDLLVSSGSLGRSIWLEEPRVLAAIGKIGPFLLLVVEYWVYDYFVDRLQWSPDVAVTKADGL